MIISNRKHYSTAFTLYYSRVNKCFIFRRDDVGTNTETKLLNDCNSEEEAKQYFNTRIQFYCEVNNINLNDMSY